MGECNQNNICFQRILERSTTYFLTRISLTVPTDVFLSIKNLKNSILGAIILKQKGRSATKVIYVFFMENVYFRSLFTSKRTTGGYFQ